MRADYREILAKGDIVTIRRALREAIFMYSQEGVPSNLKPQRESFEKLLRKIGGKPMWQLPGQERE